MARAYTINMIPGGIPQYIDVSQYDKGYTIDITLQEGNNPYTIPSGALVRVQGTKSDHYGFDYPCTVSNNVIKMPVEEQMTVFAGPVSIELVISVNGSRIGSANAVLNVEEAALQDTTIISDSDMPLIREAIGAAETAVIAAENAESSAEEAAQILSSKVDKAGDTMTGALKIQATDITIGAPPSANTFSANRITFEDSNGVRMGYLAPFYRTTDVNGYDVSAVRTVDGVDKFNSLKLEVDNAGTPTVRVTDPASWRSAIGAVNKAGDTMTGQLTFSGAKSIVNRDTDASINTSPSANRYGSGYYLADSTGAAFGALRPYHLANGNRGIFIESNPGATNTLRLGATGTTPTIYMSHPETWRAALLNKTVNISGGIVVAGHITSSTKAVTFFVPYSFAAGGTISINNLRMNIRFSGFQSSNSAAKLGYLYIHSTDSGGQDVYTPAQSSCWFMQNGAFTRPNEISSITATSYAEYGYYININFVNQLCADSSGNTIGNNIPIAVHIAQLTGTIS